MTDKLNNATGGRTSDDYPVDRQTVERIKAAALKAEELQRLQRRTPEDQRRANLAWMRKQRGVE